MGVCSGIPGTFGGHGRGWKNWDVGAEEEVKGVCAGPRAKGKSDSAGVEGSMTVRDDEAGARYVDIADE